MLENISSFELLIGLVLLLPLCSFVVSLLIRQHYEWIVSISAPVLLLGSAIISVYLFFSAQSTPQMLSYEWFQVGTVKLECNFYFDSVSSLILMMITLLSFLIHVYSTGYMAGDRGIRRYFAMLGFFTFSMLGITLAGNLVLLFLFWELVGFSSYLLIGHWMDKPAAGQAAQKAFLFNRIGDAAFLIGILIVWVGAKTVNIHELLVLPESFSWQTAAALCIFCGVIGKSAQLPLFSWLPDAMEGPTPVSALIHAATMVAAGIFLLVRIFPLFTETSLIVIAFTGAVTSLAAAVCALNQFDIKKILAYSTISQLGLMVAAVGVGAKDAALLHLFTHAFFKAGLFLAAGSIIHVLHQYQHRANMNFDVQDIRNLGGLRKSLPFTCLVFCIASASLAGIPLLSGFLSKDAILTATWLWAGSMFSWKWIVLGCLILSSFLTVLYAFRMTWFIFFGKENNTPTTPLLSPWVMRAPVRVLMVASLWLIISPNPLQLTGWYVNLFPGIEHSNLVTGSSVVLIVVAFISAWFIYSRKNTPATQPFIQNGYGLDTLYHKIFVLPVMHLALLSSVTDRKWINGALHVTAYAQVSVAHGIAWFDKYIIDGVVNLGAWLAKMFGSFTRSFQGGNIQLYIFWAITGIIIFLFFALI